MDPEEKAVYFRFQGDPSIAQAACSIAHSWSRGEYQEKEGGNFTERTNQVVGYSSASFQTVRAIKSALGTSTFGNGARARLAKYKRRDTCAPKNAICTELAILAYQLSVGSEDECRGFIMLDAKHTLLKNLAEYLSNNQYWRLDWQIISRIRILLR